MACLTSCEVCGTNTLDSSICPMCQRVIARCALDGNPIVKEDIRGQVEDARQEVIDDRMKEMLIKCPHCGK